MIDRPFGRVASFSPVKRNQPIGSNERRRAFQVLVIEVFPLETRLAARSSDELFSLENLVERRVVRCVEDLRAGAKVIADAFHKTHCIERRSLRTAAATGDG